MTLKLDGDHMVYHERIPIKDFITLGYLADMNRDKLEEYCSRYILQRRMCETKLHDTFWRECLETQVRKHCNDYKLVGELYICERCLL